LKGLQKLQLLSFGHNQISDISVLKDLHNLQSLVLTYNQISDISVLKDLHNLQYLFLAYNQITDFTPILQLHKLKQIIIDYHKIPLITSTKFAFFLHQIMERKQPIGIDAKQEYENPPFFEQICNLMASDDEVNHILARQLAESQGWAEPYIWFYFAMRK
jgi:hypothetical protein